MLSTPPQGRRPESYLIFLDKLDVIFTHQLQLLLRLLPLPDVILQLLKLQRNELYNQNLSVTKVIMVTSVTLVSKVTLGTKFSCIYFIYFRKMNYLSIKLFL